MSHSTNCGDESFQAISCTGIIINNTPKQKNTPISQNKLTLGKKKHKNPKLNV